MRLSIPCSDQRKTSWEGGSEHLDALPWKTLIWLMYRVRFRHIVKKSCSPTCVVVTPPFSNRNLE